MRFSTRIFIAMIVVVPLLGLAGCKGKPPSSASSGSANPDPSPVVPPAAPVVSAAVPLALKLFTVFDGQSAVNNLVFLETGTTTCQATPAVPIVTCTVVVPEGRLYFSSLNFRYSWLPSSCRLLNFQPYYYQASNSGTYTPPGTTSTIDCTPTSPTAPCYAGAAPGIVPDFPNFRSIIHIPDETSLTTPLTNDIKLDSGYSTNTYSNRRTVNDMNLGAGNPASNYTSAQLGGVGDEYVGGTYVEYTYSCRDDWYDPLAYVIHLKVRDEDSAVGTATPINNFRTWKEL